MAIPHLNMTQSKIKVAFLSSLLNIYENYTKDVYKKKNLTPERRNASDS